MDSGAAPVPADQTIPEAHAAWNGGMTVLKHGLGGLAVRVAETAQGWKPGTPKFQTIPQAIAIAPKNVERLSPKAGLGVGLGAKQGAVAGAPTAQTILEANAIGPQAGGMTVLKHGLGGLAVRVAETAQGWKPGTPKFQTIPQAIAIAPKNVERLSPKAGLGVGLGAKQGAVAGAPTAQTILEAHAIGPKAGSSA